ncbi:PH domain-containing protein [Agromyces agglutinans]|uniref:PH domain-containing protein n=1 Tax=Agromyces agglutinans TaxID=2662258 RepID=UPI001C12AC56|nr:PH domain-containing protein [Agromyces agglutinans]
MSFFDPKVHRHLISDQGEVVVDEVRKHWTAMVKPVLEMLLAIPVLLLLLLLPKELYFLPLLIAPAILIHATWRLLDVRMDRFVITNMRVFRVHGILSQHIATMPIARILDISVKKPLIGRVLGYGHFIFESAAQDQGLREIRFVGDPDERGLTIQRVIQRAGLRGSAGGRGGDGMPVGPVSREEYVRSNTVVEVDRRAVAEDDDGTGSSETRGFDRIIGDPMGIDVVERDSWTQPIPTQDGR